VSNGLALRSEFFIHRGGQKLGFLSYNKEVIKEYIAYLKDNPEGYWFKREFFGAGRGWTPVKWQGWLTVLVFVAFMVWDALDLTKVPEPSNNMIAWFFIKMAVAVAVFFGICFKKGEKPSGSGGYLRNKSR
jgi:hypothetical protein